MQSQYNTATSYLTSFYSDILSTHTDDCSDDLCSSHIIVEEFCGDMVVSDTSNDIWTPAKVEKKRKRRSAAQYTPEDRRNSTFWLKYINPARQDVPLGESIRGNLERNFGVGLEYRMLFLKRSVPLLLKGECIYWVDV